MAGEWISLAIEKIGEVVGGGTPLTADTSNFDGDIPWLTPRDLSRTHARWISRGERNISENGLKSSSAKLLPKGTVLVSSRAPIGYVAIAANPISTSQGFRSLVVSSEHEPEFMYYWFKQNRAELERHSSGSTFKELSGSDLKRIQVKLPASKLEQKAIAELLGSLDDKIEVNQRVSETLEEMTQALFTSWFFDFDPVRTKAEGRDTGLAVQTAALFPSRLGDDGIPEGWGTGSVAKLLEVNPSLPLKVGTIAPYVDMAALPTSGPTVSGYIMRETGSGSRFQTNDTLVARITPCLENGKTALVDFLAERETAWGSTEFIVLRPRAPMPPAWPYLLARDDQFRAHLIGAMTGSSGRQRVPPSAVKAWEMALPPPEILAAFGTIVDPLFEQIHSASNESAMLCDLRDALLPKLISGELRIKDIESAVEAA